MQEISNFQISNELHRSKNSTVYRAKDRSSNQKVIIKVYKKPSRNKIDFIKNEYNILSKYHSDSMVNCIDLFQSEGDWVLVLDDDGSVSLDKKALNANLSTTEFLKLAIKITSVIEEIHSKGITHKDINPSNLIVDPSGEVKVIDLELGSLRDSDFITFSPVNKLAGTLAYMSPEQTGRMNRSIDYRSDFYSLGITFFELLTGEYPFMVEDKLTWVYHHIATKVDVESRLAKYPKIIARIIDHLLEKKAESRYQSASGIRFDLEKCLEAIEAGQAEPDFEIGSQDVKHTFSIPETLYGREKEINLLVNNFLSNEKKQVSFISGPSGIGKTVLVNELLGPITKENGIFVTGKFDQFQGDILGIALVNAVSDILKLALTKSDKEIAHLRESLLNAFGINAKVMTDILPELEMIIGKQKEPAPLGPIEAQTRFELLFVELFKVLCERLGHIVMFIDDLQWASARSIHLIELLLTNEKVKPLYFIGAFRDNEVDKNHPLSALIDSNSCINQSEIKLAPLNQNNIKDMIDGTFTSKRDSSELAKLTLQKTAGNPFSVDQFLKVLYQKKICTFNNKELQWDWDVSEIQKSQISDNVVDYLIGMMKELPESAQKLLNLSACIGNRFSLQLLKNATDLSEDQIHDELISVVSASLIRPLNNSEYKFAHDKIQQSAYELVSKEERSLMHMNIGKQLLSHIVDGSVEPITVVSHLNHCESIIDDSDFRLELAEMNFEASQKAKSSTAFDQASVFLSYASRFLPSNANESHHETFFKIEKERGSLYYLSGDYNKCEEHVRWLLDQLEDPIEKAEAHNILIIQYTAQGVYDKAISEGRLALRCLGITLPSENLKNIVPKELAAVRELIPSTGIESLYDAPEMEDKLNRVAVEILINLDSPCYLSNIDLYCIVVAKIVQLSLTYGPVPESAKGYASYGIVLCSFNEFSLGFDFNALGIKIAERFSHLGQKCRACHTMANHVQFWTQHIKEGDAYNEEGFKAGHDAGEHLWAGFIKLFKPYNQFFRGRNLEELQKDIHTGIEFCTEHPNQIGIDTLRGLSIAISQLQDAERENEVRYIEECQQNQSLMSLSMYMSLKVQNDYILQRFDESLEASFKSQELLPYSFSVITNVTHYCFQSLAILAVAKNKNFDESLMTIVESNQEKMKRFMDNCPENFAHMYYLVEAERLLHKGDTYLSLELYDKAAAYAQESEYVNIESVIRERMARVWKLLMNDDFARLQIQKAAGLYRAWGAWGKSSQLETEFALTTRDQDDDIEKTTTITTSWENFDIKSILLSSQVISKNLIKEDLLEAMLDIMVINTGAAKGFIVLNKGEKLFVSSQSGAKTIVSLPTSLDDYREIPHSLINYVWRTKTPILYGDSLFANQLVENSSYFSSKDNLSVLVVPIADKGILYLENNEINGAFTKGHFELLDMLVGQLAISLENSELYERLSRFNSELEYEVQKRTIELMSEKEKAEGISNELRTAQRQLIDTARSAGRADIMSNILHNVGNSITSIMTVIYRMDRRIRKKSLSPEELYEVLGNDVKALKKKGESVSELLVTHLEHGITKNVIESVNVKELIEQALSMLEMDHLDYINIDVDFEELVKIDFGNTLTILMNLLNNAKTACDRSQNPSQIDIHASLKDKSLVIEVFDNGVGFSKDAQKTLFKAGLQSNRFGKGYGLHNSSNLAKQLQGSLTAVSYGENQGARFKLVLPLS
ncbi:ATP-binding sensor histidine kinase [Halobacteriovorax sp. RZ-1]|uniref:sensor histidine kinase n=1 Tax=unclassified Halobacteriovorax TaxID=2639665 RepID=UPI00371AE325